MTALNELDTRLRAFINAPDNFLDIMGLVNALHNFPVLASEQPYAIEVDGVAVVPVFTDHEDLEQFKANQASANQQHWIERPSLEVLEEVIIKQLSGIVYNLKKTGDAGNSTIFHTNDMVTFINNYTTMLNNLLNETNQAADMLDKYYLIPAFYLTKEEGKEERIFPTMSNPEGDSYVPIFSNLTSFAKWYNEEDFGGAFRKAHGMITTGKISDIYRPDSGENDIDNTLGVVINPFDDQQALVDWATLA